MYEVHLNTNRLYINSCNTLFLKIVEMSKIIYLYFYILNVLILFIIKKKYGTKLQFLMEFEKIHTWLILCYFSGLILRHIQMCIL